MHILLAAHILIYTSSYLHMLFYLHIFLSAHPLICTYSKTSVFEKYPPNPPTLNLADETPHWGFPFPTKILFPLHIAKMVFDHHTSPLPLTRFYTMMKPISGERLAFVFLGYFLMSSWWIGCSVRCSIPHPTHRYPIHPSVNNQAPQCYIHLRWRFFQLNLRVYGEQTGSMMGRGRCAEIMSS